jgi:hypothetical protein
MEHMMGTENKSVPFLSPDSPFTGLKESAKVISACVNSAANYADKKCYYRNQKVISVNFI